MLKKILLTLLVLLVVLAMGLFILISVQPSTYTVQRSASMAAVPADIFPHVNDLAAWHAWSPWRDLDPNPKRTFSTPSSGKGATFAWSGNDAVGEGTLTILESVPPERVEIEQAFVRPFEGKTTMTFTFAPEGEGTLVTWKMHGEIGFLGKAMCLVIDMDAVVGTSIEAGLANIKDLVEKQAEQPAS